MRFHGPVALHGVLFSGKVSDIFGILKLLQELIAWFNVLDK